MRFKKLILFLLVFSFVFWFPFSRVNAQVASEDIPSDSSCFFDGTNYWQIQEIYTETVEYPDGTSCYTEIWIAPVRTEAPNSITAVKALTYRDSNGSVCWEAMLTASFIYDGSSSACTGASLSFTSCDSAYSLTSSCTSHSGSQAYSSYSITCQLLDIPIKTTHHTLTLTCDPNGNVR